VTIAPATTHPITFHRSGISPRVRLVRPPHSLSTSSHWEFAFHQSKGEYVTFLLCDECIRRGSGTIAEALAVLRRARGFQLLSRVACRTAGTTAPERPFGTKDLAVPGFTNKTKVLQPRDTIRELRSPRCKWNCR
jgi:hypothetical protein